MAVFIIISVFVSIAIGAIAFLLLRYRRLVRDAKNIERSLKMIPMLIHLPPSSDDIEVGSRDSRDVAEETIAKAQTLYDIVASTYQKSFKHNKIYGQRHIAFEIVASHGLVHYYVAVPISLQSVVEQAIVSAYPAASLEEVSEHNIFSPVGKISGTIGGEFELKQGYENPIATFQETKRDAMQSMLNALSNLGPEDGAGVQIMLRPANENWTNKAKALVESKKKGKSSGGFGWYFKQVFTGKVPDGEEASRSEDKQLSTLEQQTLDAIENKTKYPGYEVLIRVVASSNTATRSQTILNNVSASFALFDAPGKNGFKYNSAQDIEAFVTAYIMRLFPQELNKNVLNSVELATVFHFPDQKSTPTSQVERQASKQVDGPRNMPSDGLLMGHNVFRGLKKEIRLSDDDRRRHLYTVGQTGTGKSVFIKNLALQDMLSGKGFAFIDPHGDAVDELMGMVPKERVEDIIYFNPGELEYPLGLNLFEFHTEEQKDFLIQEVINMLYKLYDPQRQGIIGPRYEHMFRNAALALMADPKGSTFIDIPKLFTDQAFVQEKIKHVTDQPVIDFWTKEIPASQRSNEFGEVKSWFVSKFGAFLSNKMMRNIIGQTKSSFDLRDIMDNKKILLVNLSKGKTGELNSKLLGMIFVMKFQAAAMSRSDIPEHERVDFTLYVDEFQNFSTDSFATILSEARKYRLSLIVANQFISQLSDEIRDAVFGNVGSVVSLRTGANDADFLVKQFSPVFDTADLVKLPNYHAVVRMMVGGVPSQPFSMNTIPPLGEPNEQVADAVKNLSYAKFGKPRAIVDKEINERLATRTPAKPAFNNRAPGQPGQVPPRRPQTAGAMPQGGIPPDYAQGMPGARPARPGAPQAPQMPRQAAPPQPNKSFLDNWMDKRNAALKAASSPQPTGPLQGQPLTAPPQTPIGGQPPAQPKPQTQQNISGEKQDNEEIKKVADYVKGEMKSGEKTPPAPNKPKPTPIKKEPATDKDGAKEMQNEDEIYIDKDGNLHYNDEREEI